MVKIKRANKTVVTIPQIEHSALAVTLYLTCDPRHRSAEDQVNIPCFSIEDPLAFFLKSFMLSPIPLKERKYT